MKWTDIHTIAEYLFDTYPEVDPQTIHFVELRNWILAIPEFDDDPNHCGEKILEAVQQAWINEQQ